MTVRSQTIDTLKVRLFSPDSITILTPLAAPMLFSTYSKQYETSDKTDKGVFSVSKFKKDHGDLPVVIKDTIHSTINSKQFGSTSN